MIGWCSMEYIASFSGGKDSVAMVLKLIELNYNLDEVIFYDTQLEFDCIYKNVLKMKDICNSKCIKFTILKSNNSVYYDMLIRPVNTRNGLPKYGYGWCGGRCRWGTTFKTQSITRYLKGRTYKEYVGIAFDELDRVKEKNYPLVDLKITEKMALDYCYSQGFDWVEDGIRLYDVLDRVSCYCCRNKNLKELKAMYQFLPSYWKRLEGLQSRIDEPFKKNKSIFDLAKIFELEQNQLNLF